MISDYSYLLLGLFLLIPWFMIYFLRKDLRRRIFLSSCVGAPFAFINSWFRIDYWHPPEIFFYQIMSIEDIIFAFATTGISVTIFDAIFTKKQIVVTKERKKMAFAFMPLIVLSFFFLHNFLGLNSMFMWAIPMLFFGTIIVIKRKELFYPMIFSAIISMIIAIPIYIVLFDFISPDYWKKYWLLNNTIYDVYLIKGVPYMELLWYFSWGSFAGVMYDFAKGTKKVPNKLGKKLFG